MRLVAFMILGIFSIGAAGQLSFDDVMSLENKTYKEIQAYLFRDLTIVDEDKHYVYRPISPCNPPELGEDSCQWHCTFTEDYRTYIHTNYPLSQVVFEDTSFTNYDMKRTFTSKFASNYNHQTKAATTFVEVKEDLWMSMNNCHNEIRELDLSIDMEIQFADPRQWELFKAGVAENATFQETYRMSDDSPIEVRYGIRRRKEGDYWKGVFIVLEESSNGSTFHASVYFDSWGVD